MKALRYGILVSAIATTPTVGANRGTIVLEEVIVSAQKRPQVAADIGVSLTAITGKEFRELGFEKAQDIADFTPGLSTTNATSSGTPIFAIRGIGLDDFNSNNTSGVAVYVDEVLAPYPVFLNGQLFDVERVEVLKGPQGTLYGKNSTGGATNYMSVKPNEVFDAHITLGVSRWNTTSLEVAVGGKIEKRISTRLALAANKGDGWQTDVYTGAEFGAQDDLSVRSLTSFKFGDNASLLLNLHYTRDDGTSISPQNLDIDEFIAAPPGSTFGAVSNDPAGVRVGDLDLQRDERGLGGSIKFNANFDAFAFTSITAIDNYKRNNVDNYDGSPINTNDIVFTDVFDVYSQEFRLTSSTVGCFSWIAGLTYSYDRIDAETVTDVGGFFLAPGISLGASSIYEQRSSSLGAYVHTETDLTETIQLTLGIRYSQDEREFEGGTFDRDGFVTGVPFGVIAELDERNSDGYTAARTGLAYTPLANWLLYANIATSYKAGVFYAAPVGVPEALSYVEQEEVLAYEFGFKAKLLKDSMQVSGALYEYQYDDRQSLVTVTTSGQLASTFATLGNVPESEIRGGELEVHWLPTQQLNIRLGASYIDAEVTRPPSSIRGLDLHQPIVKGETLSQAPKWSYNAVARYYRSVGSYLASVQAQYSWAGKQVASLADSNAEYGEIGSLGLRLSLEPGNGDWLISAWGSNLGDKKSLSYAFTSVEGGRVIYRQSPVNYGLELTYRF